MKVSTLFMDYDGTIAPSGVSREESRVPLPLFSLLERISTKIPVAIVTSKDLRFVKPRTTFAWAWATALGLELRLRDGSGRFARVARGLGEAVASVRTSLPAAIEVEEKRGSDGSLLGVSFDWTRSQTPTPTALKEAEKALVARGFQVNRFPGDSYMDVYAAPADKGTALKALLGMLDARRPVMYLGDTLHDNDAFDEADVAVCVQHRGRADPLRCQYGVRFEGVRGFLADLIESGFEFAQPSLHAEEA